MYSHSTASATCANQSRIHFIYLFKSTFPECIMISICLYICLYAYLPRCLIPRLLIHLCPDKFDSSYLRFMFKAIIDAYACVYLPTEPIQVQNICSYNCEIQSERCRLMCGRKCSLLLPPPPPMEVSPTLWYGKSSYSLIKPLAPFAP